MFLPISLVKTETLGDTTDVRQRAFAKANTLPAARPLASQEDRSWIFLGLVVIARAKHPVPSRTRKLSAFAPMVLRLKAWESRSPPNLVKSKISKTITLRIPFRSNRPEGDTQNCYRQYCNCPQVAQRAIGQTGSSSAPRGSPNKVSRDGAAR